MKKTNYQQFSFVNGFDGSQLRSRIEMMNRRPNRWGMLKYFLMIMMASSLTMAFVTKEQVTHVLQKIPAFKAEVEPKVVEPKVIMPKPKALPAPEAKKFRYAYQKGGHLYLLITANMSLDDLSKVQEILTEKTGEEMEFSTLDYDPLNKYITKIVMSFRRSRETITHPERITDSHFKPIKSLAFTFDLADKTYKKRYLSTSVEPKLTDIAKEDSLQISEDYQRLKKSEDVARRLMMNGQKTGGWSMSFISKAQFFSEIKRQPDADGSIFLKRGDFFASYLEMEKGDSSIVYMSDAKILTDEELSQINTKEIALVHTYYKYKIEGEIKAGKKYKTQAYVVHIIKERE